DLDRERRNRGVRHRLGNHDGGGGQPRQNICLYGRLALPRPRPHALDYFTNGVLVSRRIRGSCGIPWNSHDVRGIAGKASPLRPPYRTDVLATLLHTAAGAPPIDAARPHEERTMRSARTSHIRITAPAQVILLAGSLLWSLPALAQTAPERLTDNEVRELIEQGESGREKFEGNLERKFKDSVLRNPTGEVKVARSLQDYQDNIKKLKERFTDDSSASAEVGTVLKQASNFDKFLHDTPSIVKGRSEWGDNAAEIQ